jgi:hypothetical protein
MKTSVTMRKYTVILGLLLIAMFIGTDDPKAEFLMQTEIKQKLYFRFRRNTVAYIYDYKTQFKWVVKWLEANMETYFLLKRKKNKQTNF